MRKRLPTFRTRGRANPERMPTLSFSTSSMGPGTIGRVRPDRLSYPSDTAASFLAMSHAACSIVSVTPKYLSSSQSRFPDNERQYTRSKPFFIM